jgi:hypothetical protein
MKKVDAAYVLLYGLATIPQQNGRGGKNAC